jgi:small subunit ribosomal protein S8
MSMLSTDPIADMLTRVRNAINVGKTQVTLPSSNVKEGIAKELVSAGFLAKVEVEKVKPQDVLKITINAEGSAPTITHIERISKPGRRMYVKASEIPTVKNGRGIVIVSTSKGIMTGKNAYRQRLGGELICKVY